MVGSRKLLICWYLAQFKNDIQISKFDEFVSVFQKNKMVTFLHSFQPLSVLILWDMIKTVNVSNGTITINIEIAKRLS